MKEKIFKDIEENKKVYENMADYIFDNPELGGNEFEAMEIITKFLEENGFSVEKGIANLPTSFRAIYKNGSGYPRIGILCEYDALEGLGHGCSHHLQAPTCLATAMSIKENLKDKDYTLVIYGTPGEETFGGKVDMLDKGYFRDIDVALMMHGADSTCVDIKSLARSGFTVIFHGKKAHAALRPEEGRSALDALLLSFNGIEFLREHTREDTRMHYTILETPGPENVVPSKAVGKYSLRSYSREYLDGVVARFKDIIRGASLMSGTTYEIIDNGARDNKIPSFVLNDLFMENAKLVNAPDIRPPREKTGSTDFGNVMHEIPGSCIRVKFVESGTSSHSQEFIDMGKSQSAHEAIVYGAKILAGTIYDIITMPKLIDLIKTDYENNKKRYN